MSRDCGLKREKKGARGKVFVPGVPSFFCGRMTRLSSQALLAVNWLRKCASFRFASLRSASACSDVRNWLVERSSLGPAYDFAFSWRSRLCKCNPGVWDGSEDLFEAVAECLLWDLQVDNEGRAVYRFDVRKRQWVTKRELMERVLTLRKSVSNLMVSLGLEGSVLQ